MSDEVKMSFNAAALRVRCEISRAACLASEAPPEDLLSRAKAKLESLKAKGEVAFYTVYDVRLNETWKALREAKDEPEDRRIQLTLGAGAPALAGIKVEKPNQEKAIASLTIEAPKSAVVTWRWEWFKLTIIRRLRESNIKDMPNNAQLYAAFNKARAGEKVVGAPLNASAQAGGQTGKAFSVVANKQRMEIGVVVRNVKDLRDKANRDMMLTLINQAVRQLSTDGVDYKIMKKDFLAALQGAIDGPESLGLELPLILLAASGQVGGTASNGIPAPAPANYPGAGKIQFEVSKDKLEATISGFQMSYYDDPSFQANFEWVQAELKRNHLNLPIAEDVAKGIKETLRKREDLNGCMAVRGFAGKGGKGPTLHHSYKDASSRGQDLDKGVLDIREMQQRAVVKTGQLIAEIRYAEAPEPGRNVFGEEVPPPASDELIVRVGDDVQQRDGGKFYATADGMPLIEDGTISLSKAFVHNGDVNLRSGNIRFEGPVEIKGSIDSGAVVEAQGDLTVHGSIRGGFVQAKGNITVMSGITTGPGGQVRSRGNLTAEFIENSNIVCGGDLTVQKALIGSRVYVGGTVKVPTKTGVIAGGSLFCRGSVETDNLGFRNGAITKMYVGVDWRAARSLDIRQLRLEKLQKRMQDDRLALRELVQKSKAQMTARHKELKDELQERLLKIKTVTEKAEALVQKATLAVTYSDSARIFVKELLVTNVSITIGGQTVPVPNDLINVAVLAKRRRGSFIVALEEIDAEENKNGDGKKAS